jgi:hypothetical protein
MATKDLPVIPMKEWLQRSSLEYFERNASALMVPKVVHLCSDTLVKVMSRSFEVVSRDAHYITIASRLILADRVSGKIYQEEEVFKAETAINWQLELVDDYLDGRIKQAEQKLIHAGIDPNVVERVTRGYASKCATPTATDYLELIIKADIYLAMFQYLWVAGELSNSRDEALKVKLNNERQVRDELGKVVKMCTKHFHVLRRICNAVLADRKLDRDKQSARDKRKHAEQMAKEQSQKDMDVLAKVASQPAMAEAEAA